MWSVSLTRITSNHSNLRTSEVDGWADVLPKVGECFILTAPPLEMVVGLRFIHTTPVEAIEIIDKDDMVFKTANSTYRLSMIKEVYNNEVETF